MANDGEPNLLWEQNEDGTFADAALFLGVALNAQGRSEASMGVLLGDVDGDGDLDLLLVNGAVAREGGIPVSEGLAAYAEPALAFLGDGSGRFEERALEGFTDLPVVGRGLATGDWDRDGDLDLVVTSVGGPARLFENRSARSGAFLIVEPREFGRPSPGAVVTLEPGERALVRALNPEAGYLTSSEPVAHFGIPAGAEITGLRVRWPDGVEERFDPPLLDTRVAVVRSVALRERR